MSILRRLGGALRDISTQKRLNESVALLKDVKVYNAHGDSISTGGWRTRILNTLEGDTSFVSTSGNMGTGQNNVPFTLKKGIYYIATHVPFYQTNNAQHRLYNVTTSSQVVLGTSIYSYSSESNDINSESHTIVDINGPNEYRIEVKTEAGGRTGTSFYTDASSLSVYSTVRIFKLK